LELELAEIIEGEFGKIRDLVAAMFLDDALEQILITPLPFEHQEMEEP
jgi:hypothetical protein